MLSQLKDHAPYGGVVPEIAARAHVNHLDRLVAQAMAEAGLGYDELDGVAATAGPGLLGGVIVGLTMAKAIALAHGKPLLAVNHLEGHALDGAAAADGANFPICCCSSRAGTPSSRSSRAWAATTASARPSMMRWARPSTRWRSCWGWATPAAPRSRHMPAGAIPARFDFPRPLKGRKDCNFSFSGLKTAVREVVNGLGTLSARTWPTSAASFEAAVAETVADRLTMAVHLFRAAHPDVESPALIVAGGVAANQTLKAVFEQAAERHGLRLIVPPPRLCTDNAAMIAWAGAERLALGLVDDLGVAARARWPLDQAQAPVYGSGKLGAKA